MFEAVGITLQGVGYAIFNLTFVFGIWLLFNVNRKLNILDYYRSVSRKPFLFLMSDIILQGILVGVVTSLVLVVVGIPLYFNDILLMIIPISLVLSIYRVRLLCVTYSASVLALISLVFNGQTLYDMVLPSVELHVPSIVILVGLLHLIEGLFILLTAHSRAVPVLSKRDDKIIMGHIMHKSWVLPLSVLVLQIGLVSSGGTDMPSWWPLITYSGYDTNMFYTLFPMIGMLSYSTIVYNETPKERTRFSGISIILFGIITLCVGVLSIGSFVLQFVGIVLMIFIHEGMYHLEQIREKKMSPIYSVPDNGVRIMQILEGGYASKLGMKKGDIIEKINHVQIQNIGHFISLIKEKQEQILIETTSLKGLQQEYKIKDIKELEHIGIRLLPEKPLMLYPYNQFGKLGIFEFIKRT